DFNNFIHCLLFSSFWCFMYMFEIIIIYVMFFILSRKVLATYQKHQTDNYKGAYELTIPHVTHLHFYKQYIPILYNSSIMVITHFYLFVHLSNLLIHFQMHQNYRERLHPLMGQFPDISLPYHLQIAAIITNHNHLHNYRGLP